MLGEAWSLWFAERERLWGVVCGTVQEQVRLQHKLVSLSNRPKQIMKVVGGIPSIAAKESARIYRLPPNERALAIHCYPPGRAVTFSFFARTETNQISLRVSLEGPFSSQTKDFLVTDAWQRFELSMKNDISLQPLKVFLSNASSTTVHSDVAIAFPQCEEGLFATSPIPPDVELPVVVASASETGSTRSADRAWIDKDKTGIEIDSNSSTVILVAKPTPTTAQIQDDQFLTLFSFWCSESTSELSIGISGSHNCAFVIRKRTAENVEFTCTSYIAGCDLYFVCAVFDQGTVSLIVNGAIAARLLLSESMVFERIYLGCSHGCQVDSFSGHFMRFIIYGTPLLYPRILEMYCECCPGNVNYTYAYMLDYFRYALTDDSEMATLDACMADEGFSFFIRQLQFAIPEVFEQFPPHGEFQEADIRDWVLAIIKRPGVRASRESYSKIRRTDLRLAYTLPGDGSATDLVEKQYRIEFKIWGRHGYKDVPSQPMKYMTEDELVGASIMIDRRATPSICDFEDYVRANPDYQCISIKEIPVMEANLRYFVSFHRDLRYRMLRMMINILLPIPGPSLKIASDVLPEASRGRDDEDI
ncbi:MULTISPECIES: hypothetical protein [Synechococcales]|uniref:hypothetical protein n=1 Tax=Synechococcus sp. CS-1333 TaxID=2848638 RepID=UPI00223B913D|nr:hypothetical protein [Synechococcus sp. CS-1333]MCT0211701.1 hypothetical protein [Synechococcus sp. CS-1333]